MCFFLDFDQYFRPHAINGTNGASRGIDGVTFDISDFCPG